LLSHDDLQQLLNTIEVYIDKKMMPQMNVMNAIYRLSETIIKENFTVDARDEVRVYNKIWGRQISYFVI